jgi:hypothetical protein
MYTSEQNLKQNISPENARLNYKMNSTKSKKSPTEYIFSFSEIEISLMGTLSESTVSASPNTIQDKDLTNTTVPPAFNLEIFQNKK